MHADGAQPNEVQLSGGLGHTSNEPPGAETTPPTAETTSPVDASDTASVSDSEFSTTDTTYSESIRRTPQIDSTRFQEDETFRHEHNTGRRPTLTTVREVDVLSVYPGVQNIEYENRPLMQELSENVVRYKQRAVDRFVEHFRGSKKRPWGPRLRRLPFVFIPSLRWLSTYSVKKYLRDDIIAGVTVGIMLVPQSLSYAKLAGLSPVYGLYTGLMPMFAYALFGSSRQLSVGPVAIISQVIHAGLVTVVDPTLPGTTAEQARAQALYNSLAITVALFVGLEECILGLLRLGWLIRFVSHTVVSGFTSGAAITIALSQIKYFLGYSISSQNQIVPVLSSTFKNISKFKWQPFVMGVIFVFFLLGMRKIARQNTKLWWCRVIAPLVTVVAGTVFMTVVHTKTISTVGKIPKGLPGPSTSNFKTGGYLGKLLLTSLIVTGVGILETVGIAKALAAKNGYEINANQELFGLGIANLVGSLFSAYPSTGSFSRSAVSNDMGAKTGLAGVFTGLLILCTLLFLTPLFKNLPNAVLGAIVIAACIKLFDYSEAAHLLRTNFRDFLLWMAAFLGTIFLGIEIGVAIAVGLSLVFVIYESANPHMAILGRLPGTAVYRNIKQYPDAIVHPGILIIRIDAPMYYANVSYIKDKLRHYLVTCIHPSRENNIPDLEAGVAPPDWPFPRKDDSDDAGEAAPGGTPVRYIILDMTPVTYVDSTAVHALKDLHQEYTQQGLHLALSNTNKRVMVTLTRTGFLQKLGAEWHFVRAHDAVQVIPFAPPMTKHRHVLRDIMLYWTRTPRSTSTNQDAVLPVALQNGSGTLVQNTSSKPGQSRFLKPRTSGCFY